MNLGLVEMMRYNAWANSTLFDACRELTDEQLDARLPVTSGSTRELLTHIVAASRHTRCERRVASMRAS